MRNITLFFIKSYKNIVSPFFDSIFGKGSMCRFEPTCSQFMYQSVEKHGAFKGIKAGIKRILKCHPWGQSGYDPVK